MSNLIAIFVFLLLVHTFPFNVQAGTCFVRQESDGKCRKPAKFQATRNECCSKSSFAFSEEIHTDSTLQLAITLYGGVDCSHCPATDFKAKSNRCKPGLCSPGERCIATYNGVTRCTCDSLCTDVRRNSGPVCASNGMTFANMCKLHQYRCANGFTSLSVVYKGKCKSSCDAIKCPFDLKCIIGSDGQAMCLPCKPRNCGAKQPLPFLLCSSTGIAFHNECELEQEICRQGHVITVRPTKKCLPKIDSDRSVKPSMRQVRTLNSQTSATGSQDSMQALASQQSSSSQDRKAALAALGREMQQQFHQQHRQQQQHRSGRSSKSNKSHLVQSDQDLIYEFNPTDPSMD